MKCTQIQILICMQKKFEQLCRSLQALNLKWGHFDFTWQMAKNSKKMLHYPCVVCTYLYLPKYLPISSRAPFLPVPPGHGTGCFFAPPRKSVHKLVHIFGAPKKHPQIPEVALVDFTPDRRQWPYYLLTK